MKAIILLTTALITCNTAKSQASQIEWISTSGNGAGNEVPIGISLNNNQQVTNFGHFTSLFVDFGSQHLTNSGASGSSDAYSVTYDQTGSTISSKSFSGLGSEWIRNLNYDASDNVYVSGVYNGPSITIGGGYLGQSTSDDSFISKSDPAGNTLWTYPMSGDGRDIIRDMKVNASGIYLVGTFSGTSLTYGNTTLTNVGLSGYREAFVMKLDLDGKHVWTLQLNGTSEELADKIVLDDAGNLLVAGSYNSASMSIGGQAMNNTSGFWNGFLLKISESGQLIWSQNIADTDDVYGQAVQIDKLGQATLAGYFESASIVLNGTTFTNNSNPGYGDFYVVKFDQNGNTLWAETGGGNSTEIPTAICFDLHNNLYMTGYHYSATIDFANEIISGQGNEDIFMLSYDAAGNEGWIGNIGGNGGDYAFDMLSDDNGNIYLSGRFEAQAELVLGNQTQQFNSYGMADAILLKISKLASLTNLSESNLMVYPNPTSDVLMIGGLWDSEVIQYQLINQSGQIQLDSRIQSLEMKSIDLCNIPSGVYTLRLTTGEQSQCHKVVKL